MPNDRFPERADVCLSNHPAGMPLQTASRICPSPTISVRPQAAGRASNHFPTHFLACELTATIPTSSLPAVLQHSWISFVSKYQADERVCGRDAQLDVCMSCFPTYKHDGEAAETSACCLL